QEQAVTELSQKTLSTTEAQGECPNIFFESSKTLSNGAVVTWTSSFGGFDYTKGTNDTVTVSWSVDPPTVPVMFVSFDENNKVWTPPKDVGGTWDFSPTDPPSSDSLLTVNMSEMHRAIEPDWHGFIGNGHFKLVLDVDGIRVKLGVNVHLEDPDGGYTPRCP
ncbi:MAG: hypothetical protein ACE5JB_15025, partial [bacterium]